MRSNRVIIKVLGKEARLHSQVQKTAASKGDNTDFLITFDKLNKMFLKTLSKHYINSNKRKCILKEKKLSKSDLYWLYTLLQITRSVNSTSCFSNMLQTKSLNTHLKFVVNGVMVFKPSEKWISL